MITSTRYAGSEQVVGIAGMAISGEPAVHLVTYALGSCLGITVYDPIAGVGGLLHVMLPSSEIDPEKARRNPCVFVDTGVPELFRACYRAGAVKERMIVKVAGGSFGAEHEEADRFQVGKRNLLTLRRLLWKNGVLIRAEDVGGQRTSRNLLLRIATGDVIVRASGREAIL
jgi:chemotaxis protein CheD